MINKLTINYKHSHTAVIGIYYPNGVFTEDYTQGGMSYILDHALFTMLRNEFAENCDIRAFTHYGYSCCTIACSKEESEQNAERASKVLFEKEIDFGDTFDWVQWRMDETKKNRTTLDALYYAKRTPNTPLAKTLSEGIVGVPSKDALHQWRNRFVRKESSVFCTTGGIANYQEEISQSLMPEYKLPICEATRLQMPCRLPWKRMNVIYSIPIPITAENILPAEACCEILRPMLASKINDLGGRILSVRLYPDYIPELRISMQIGCDKKDCLHGIIEKALNELTRLTEKQQNKATENIYSFYRDLLCDPLQWNWFMGYNEMSGRRYRLYELLDRELLDKLISSQSVRKIAETLLLQKDNNTFAISAC